MANRSVFVSSAALAAVLVALVMRATTLHSVNAAPLIYRATANVNDLDTVEGLAPPGQYVELWVKQRNFREGNDSTDPFSWCAWKNGGREVLIGLTRAGGDGVWRMTNLRASGNTVMLFPPGPAGDKCLGGLYTELLPRACDAPGFHCTAAAAPNLHWLNVRKLTSIIAVTTGSVSNAEQTAASVADGPNDGPEFSDVLDVDQNGFNTQLPGYTVGQRVTWRCGVGGTGACPSIAVHDSSTAISTDPEYPFVLGTIQAHRTGGSFIAAAAIRRGTPIGFAVNVNVKFRGLLDINLGCDQKKFFDFEVPLDF
jgi:hypothetical protein